MYVGLCRTKMGWGGVALCRTSACRASATEMKTKLRHVVACVHACVLASHNTLSRKQSACLLACARCAIIQFDCARFACECGRANMGMLQSRHVRDTGECESEKKTLLFKPRYRTAQNLMTFEAFWLACAQKYYNPAARVTYIHLRWTCSHNTRQRHETHRTAHDARAWVGGRLGMSKNGQDELLCTGYSVSLSDLRWRIYFRAMPCAVFVSKEWYNLHDNEMLNRVSSS